MKHDIKSRLRIYDERYPHIQIKCKSIKQAQELEEEIITNERLMKLVEIRRDYTRGKLKISKDKTSSVLNINEELYVLFDFMITEAKKR